MYWNVDHEGLEHLAQHMSWLMGDDEPITMEVRPMRGNVLGRAWPAQRRIRLDQAYISMATDAEIIGIVAHEVAHILCPPLKYYGRRVIHGEGFQATQQSILDAMGVDYTPVRGVSYVGSYNIRR